MSELTWQPIEPTPQDLEFIEQQKKMQQELIEAFAVTSPLVGVVSNYTSDEKQAAQEKFYQMLMNAAYEAGRKHEH